MSSLPTNANGIAYLPDGHVLDVPKRPWPVWWRALLFIAVYLLLSTLYAQAAGSAVERFFLETLGSQPAASLVHLLTPGIDALAKGARIVATGGGLNIRNGCEGVDLYILLIAAFAAAPLAWRVRLSGLLLGLGLALALNQIRILALFYAFRSDKSLFDLLHTTAAPIALIVLLSLYFHVWLSRYR